MMASLQPLADKYAALQAREKILVVASLLAVTGLLLKLLVFTPLGQWREQVLMQQQSIATDIAALTKEQALLTQVVNSDPDASFKRELMALNTRLEALDKTLESLAVGMIPADRLPAVLEDVAKASDTLTLLQIKTLPVTVLEESDRVAIANNAESAAVNLNQVAIFRHAVVLDIEGSYTDLSAYIRELEQLPWHFYWEALDYDASDYPKSRMTLEVYTLSMGKGVFSDLR